MNRRSANLTVASSLISFTLFGCASSASGEADDGPLQDSAQAIRRGRPTIVLVHGAWAGALGWQSVTGLLLERGYPVVAVENPLSSLADDIASTKRTIEREAARGPVVVVGHSFGGAAITSAALDGPNVKALVYINAFAPDEGETIGELAAKYGPSPLADALLADSASFLFIDKSKFRDVFCGDVRPSEARIMAASQKPISAGAFRETLGLPAWRTVPSYYLVGTQDRAILPELQRYMAARMGACTVEVASSHASFVSHPSAVVRLIEDAASATCF